MKRSRKITLTLIASISIAACGGTDEQATKREIYKSKEECKEDWGGEENCEETVTTGGHRSYHGPHYFYSSGRPYYFPRGSETPMPAGSHMNFSGVSEGMSSAKSSGHVASTHITRGGFGGSSSSHSSGG
jgi:uncharacterized protein YgiB involved in biofilm formation